jgi:DNA-binding NtrC family response regulator
MVALLNSSEDVIEQLQQALDDGGFQTAAAHIADVQMGVLDLIAWMSETGADVILIDLPRPDARALNFLRLLQHVDMLHQCGWVLTTTHKDAIWTTSGESGQPHPSAGEVRKLT